MTCANYLSGIAVDNDVSPGSVFDRIAPAIPRQNVTAYNVAIFVAGCDMAFAVKGLESAPFRHAYGSSSETLVNGAAV